MMSLLLATLAGLLIPSQTDAADQRPTYIIQMKDGSGVFYGYVKDDGGKTIEVIFDSGPKAGKSQFIPKSKVDYEQEPKSARAERLQKGTEAVQKQLDDRGLVSVGPNKYVMKDEVEFARRAKAMVAEQEARKSSAGESATGAAAEGAAAPSANAGASGGTQHGFLKQWGGHIFIGAVGLVLSGLIIKTMLV